jgi:pSer/pThr/pTyr-binding forkhead associated (FHA) protein
MLAIIVFILRIFLVIVLFSFIGWTIYTLYRDLKFQSQLSVTKKVPMITLSYESEDRMFQPTFSIPDFTIGRDASCEIQLEDETISNRHARLTFKNQHWWVEDLVSTNGTYLNDEKVETATILISGDELRVGKNSLIIDIQPLN